MRISLLPPLLLAPAVAAAFEWISFGERQEQPLSAPSVNHVSPFVSKGPSTVEMSFTGTALDGPKVRPVNATTFEWWYFDAVSSRVSVGDLSSVVVAFFTASTNGFEGLSNDATILQTSLSGTYSNGTPFSYSGFPNDAVIFTKGNSSDGRWGGISSWSSSSDMTRWMIEFADPGLNVSGYLSISSPTPPQLPCTAELTQGSTEELLPGVGWSNAIPDGDAIVDFHLHYDTLEFDGAVGYHDKNWGSRPFSSSVATWYRGHGRMGPYSIVWYDALSKDGTEHVSAYVAKNGVVLSAGCTKTSVVVRPKGTAAFPPGPNSSSPEGFTVVFGDVEGKELSIEVQNVATAVSDGHTFSRWVGTLEGRFIGEEQTFVGVAIYEEFKGGK
ncbi:hypothetical protein M433DRAFT_148870 [Acidomyces richmondensis BFW]|nr:MAG: hypothetical protein FE78DRAFT_84023 [Acidomyces sp. 'richmondensis']KYG50439.1 hypothetical protein M433DRAFT_148870 [Acidomyces richmondensis BFW]